MMYGINAGDVETLVLTTAERNPDGWRHVCHTRDAARLFLQPVDERRTLLCIGYDIAEACAQVDDRIDVVAQRDRAQLLQAAGEQSCAHQQQHR